MENCFFKQLKGEFSNDDLLKYGEIRVLMDYLAADTAVSGGGAAVTAGVTVGKTGTELYFQNATLLKDNSLREFANPWTMASESVLSFLPKTRSADKGNVSIYPKYDVKALGFAFSDVINSFDDICENCTELQKFYLNRCSINGDFQKLAEKDTITEVAFTNVRMLSNANVRTLINSMAQRRANGTTLKIGVNNSAWQDSVFTDIPAAFSGTYYGNFATVYFTSDTVTYPHGWYAKAPNGTYYNANDEVISV